MEEESWQTEHFNNRRIAHGRKGKSGGKRSHFDPRRTYGKYELRCPALAKLHTTSTKPAGTCTANAPEGVLDIHGPADCHENALICTFALSDVLSGLALLAGSRKSLASAANDLERSDEAESGDAAETARDALTQSPGEDDADHALGEEEAEAPDEDGLSSLEMGDERDRSRQAAFEKNAFRSPKFWMRWRAVVPVRAQSSGDAEHPTTGAEDVEINGGYLVFSGNDCTNFSGTISCDAFDWKNVKLSGRKITSKATQCSLRWVDISPSY